ncbi:hypothetical protein I302_107172 [Kwoniella bestiolae CBS 10118]|uniref:Uncharacterized protein n=1 Tax=Kwoniella bestiolae CBS 10118 TaxID=1296100 RepID=A0A1B9FZB1_9TREE|nr:hypothetical protein I302_05562 [Kwoniella bestiolae CBS 10118]OCF24104.1 hypothetical protein I302_05562 [Kwoniella bestiolae CBS 10118]
MSSTNHPDPISPTLGSAVSAPGVRRPKITSTKSQFEKTAGQSANWAKLDRDRLDSYLLELEYQKATSDTERRSILDKYHTMGYVTEREKIWHKISMSDKSGRCSKFTFHQAGDTRRMPFVREAIERGYITQDEAERYMSYLQGGNPSGGISGKDPLRDNGVMRGEDA